MYMVKCRHCHIGMQGNGIQPRQRVLTSAYMNCWKIDRLLLIRGPPARKVSQIWLVHLITGPHYPALTTVPQDMPSGACAVWRVICIRFGCKVSRAQGTGLQHSSIYLLCLSTLAFGGVKYRFYSLRWRLICECCHSRVKIRVSMHGIDIYIYMYVCICVYIYIYIYIYIL